MKEVGLSVELLETRHVRNAFETMPVKTDRKDARGIAELMRVGGIVGYIANGWMPRSSVRCSRRASWWKRSCLMWR